MSKPQKHLAVIGPAIPDGDLDFDFELPDPASVSAEVLVKTAHSVFETDNAEFTGNVVHAALQIKASRDRITRELILLGAHMYEIFNLAQTDHIARYGDTRAVRNRAARNAFDYIQQAFSLKRSSTRLYMNCYSKFSDNSDALDVLKISELSLLLKESITEEDVAVVVEARRADASMTRAEIKELIKSREQLRAQLRVKDDSLDAMETEVAASVGKASDLERENRRLQEEIQTLKRDQAARNEELAQVHSDGARRSTSMSAMQKTVSDLTDDISRLTAQIAQYELAGPKEVEVEKIVVRMPEGIVNMEDAIRAKLDELAAAKEKLSIAEEEYRSLEENKRTLRAEIDAGAKAQRQLEALLEDWSKFSANFTLTQLAVQADGDPSRYKPMFGALTETLRKFLSEIEAAANFRQA
jgi:hypothetical protein